MKYKVGDVIKYYNSEVYYRITEALAWGYKIIPLGSDVTQEMWLSDYWVRQYYIQTFMTAVYEATQE